MQKKLESCILKIEIAKLNANENGKLEWQSQTQAKPENWNVKIEVAKPNANET